MILFLLIPLRSSSAMPGTVQVSILELKGLPPSSSSSSPTSIKVSMGKQEYETRAEKGEFTFSLISFRDNLVVKIQDFEGNQIAHTGLESRLIAEKGLWDDTFPLEGGGQVHMRLIFSLSEEEQHRIRNMRESALRKKREELLNKSHVKTEIEVASSGGKNFAASKEVSSSSTSMVKANSLNHPQDEPNAKPTSEGKESSTPSSHPTSSKEAILSSIPLMKANVSSLQEGDASKESNLNPTTISEVNKPSNSSLQITYRRKEIPSPTILMKPNSSDLPKGDNSEEGDFKPGPSSSLPLKDDPIQLQPSKEPTQSTKTSSHVRKMIKAFDNSRSLQQEISLGNPTTSASQITRSIWDTQTQKPISENINKQKTKAVVSKLKRLPSIFLVDELQEYHTSARDKKGPGATSITLCRSKSQSKIFNEAELEIESVSRSHNARFIKKENSSIPRGVEYDNGRQSSIELRRSASLDRFTDLDIAKSQSYRSLAEQQCSSDVSALTKSLRCNATPLQDVTEQKGLSSATKHSSVGSCDWIFVEEEICPCIVVGGNMRVGPLSDHRPTLVSESYKTKVSRDENLPRGATKHEETENSSDNDGTGPAGQVMKVVIMVGFGLLVLFTRQRKSK